MESCALTGTIKIRYSEMDYDLLLKPSALLHFLEDLASESAEKLGFGYTFVRSHNLAWFLLKYHMEFFNYPQKINELTIKTIPRGYNKLFAFRDFELYTEDVLIGKIISTWSLIDLTTRNIVSVEQALNENPHMKAYEKKADDLNYEKIKPLTNFNYEKTYEIRYDDIDVNGHANNSNYIVWAFEPLGFDFRCKNKLKTLDIVFKKEVKYGDKIISQIEINKDKSTHVLKSEQTGEDLCLLNAVWINK